MVKKEKTVKSKEVQAIISAVQKYIDKHDKKGNAVVFQGTFTAFTDLEKKECKVVDNISMAYGYKEYLMIDLSQMTKAITEDKEDKDGFVDWQM